MTASTTATTNTQRGTRDVTQKNYCIHVFFHTQYTERANRAERIERMNEQTNEPASQPSRQRQKISRKIVIFLLFRCCCRFMLFYMCRLLAPYAVTSTCSRFMYSLVSWKPTNTESVVSLYMCTISGGSTAQQNDTYAPKWPILLLKLF